jgi:hypothetical protein
MFRLALSATALLSLALFAASPSQAQVAGKVWFNDLSDNATNPASGGVGCTVCAGSPNDTFSVVGIDFTSFIGSNVAGNFTVGSWLNSVNSGVTLSNPADASATMTNTHFQFVGSVFLSAGANSFSIAHDDGVTINISGGIGSVLPTSAAGPTSPTVTNFSINNPGAAGNFTFTLDYNECCTAPAVLSWHYPTGGAVGGVPEPSTWAMMLLGFAGLAFAFRQSRRKVSFA